MKITNIIVGIIAIIALIGDIFFMYVLYSLGQLATAFSQMADLGLNSTDIQGITQTFSLGISTGWLWSILVLIVSLFAIKYALIDPRKKKQ